MKPPEYGPEVRVHFTERISMDVEWVMAGVSLADGRVALFASTEMGQADLRHVSSVIGPGVRVSDQVQSAYGYDLSARLSRFLFVAGANYEEALIRLLAQWRPGNPPAAVETGG